MKRLFDLVLSIIALVILWPVFIIITLLVKLDDKGSVIFKQLRVGKDNKEFAIYKFRSMKENAPVIASNDLENPDNYITNVGKILRRTSLDELPQLINIIKGDMSIVGPRPVINDKSEEELLRLRTEYGIYKLPPGLTGWAQINGRDDMSTSRKIQLEREYLEKHSFMFDLKIMFLTVYKVIKQEGVVGGSDTETKDNGSTEGQIRKSN